MTEDGDLSMVGEPASSSLCSHRHAGNGSAIEARVSLPESRLSSRAGWREIPK